MDDLDDEKPISQNIPKTDGMFTVVEKFRLPRWLVRIVAPESDEMKLFYIILGMLIMFAIWGAWDYGACQARNPECTIVECFSHNEPKVGKKK